MKFVRQFPVEPYIVDFVCREKNLIIELDGESHIDRGLQDRQREKFLEAKGFRVLRIANDDIFDNIESVLFAIVRAAGLDPVAWQRGDYGKIDPDLLPISPSPPPRRGPG